MGDSADSDFMSTLELLEKLLFTFDGILVLQPEKGVLVGQWMLNEAGRKPIVIRDAEPRELDLALESWATAAWNNRAIRFATDHCSTAFGDIIAEARSFLDDMETIFTNAPPFYALELSAYDGPEVVVEVIDTRLVDEDELVIVGDDFASEVIVAGRGESLLEAMAKASDSSPRLVKALHTCVMGNEGDRAALEAEFLTHKALSTLPFHKSLALTCDYLLERWPA